MKLKHVSLNNQKRAFEMTTHSGRELSLPYAKATPPPTADDSVDSVYVDPEVANEGFSYTLESGRSGTVLIEQVLDYHEDPDYLRNLLLYELTARALEELEQTPLSRREICRRLRTSPTQLYRLLDTTNYGKSLDKMVALLQALDCHVSLVVRPR